MANFIHRNSRFIPFIIFYILILFFIFIVISDEKDEIKIPIVQRKSFVIDSIKSNENLIILKEVDKILIKNSSLALHFLAPRDTVIDPLYDLLVLIYLILVPIYFWEFNYQKPFSLKTITGMKITIVVTILFIVGNFWRYEWINKEVERLTLGSFGYDKSLPLLNPEFILVLILIRLIQIFKKGYSIQNELDLTI